MLSTKRLIWECLDKSFKLLIIFFKSSSWLPVAHPWSEVIWSGESGTNVIWSGWDSSTRFKKPLKSPEGEENGLPSILNSTFLSLQSWEIVTTSLLVACLWSGLGWSVKPLTP